MPWLGFESKIGRDEIKRLLDDLGYKILGFKEFEVETRRGWIKFIVAEVIGFIEGASAALASKINMAVLESGKHLILGEPSAKIWREAVKISFPDGEIEVIPVYTYDGFLDIRLPTDYVKGLEGYITVESMMFKLPLSFKDLDKIYSFGKEAVKKLEKASSAYGISTILSEEALKKLEEVERERKEKVKIDVDYDSGFVLIGKEDMIYTEPIKSFVAKSILEKEKADLAKNIYLKAPPKLKKEISSFLKEKQLFFEEINEKEKAGKIRDFLRGVTEKH